MTTDFWLKSGQFRYYLMRLWIIFESCPIDFLTFLILGVFLAAPRVSCGAGPVVATCELPQGMWDPSSPSRDQTCIPCIGRQILNPWATRDIPAFSKGGRASGGRVHRLITSLWLLPAQLLWHLKWGGVFLTDEQGGRVLAPHQGPRDNSLAGRGWFASIDTARVDAGFVFTDRDEQPC